MKSVVANSKGIWYRFRSDYICTKKNSTKKSGISYVSPIIKKTHRCFKDIRQTPTIKTTYLPTHHHNDGRPVYHRTHLGRLADT